MSDPRLHIGIFGGSFNPVHIGHLLLADYLAQTIPLHAIWFMLSPQNPLKRYPSSMPSDADRLAMLRIAAEQSPRLQVTDVELDMPRPSYTIDSLRRLRELHPHTRFSLIIGSDNWHIFHQWKDYQTIIREFTPVVYPRPGYEVDPLSLPPEVTLVDAPLIDLSSTAVRDFIARGVDVSLMLPAGVADYISRKNLYR